MMKPDIGLVFFAKKFSSVNLFVYICAIIITKDIMNYTFKKPDHDL